MTAWIVNQCQITTKIKEWLEKTKAVIILIVALCLLCKLIKIKFKLIELSQVKWIQNQYLLVNIRNRILSIENF